MRRNRNKSNFNFSTSTLVVPVIIALLLLLLISQVFFGKKATPAPVGASVTVSAKDSSSVVSVYTSWDSKTTITAPTKMYPTDVKMSVESGEGEIALDGDSSTVFVDNKGEVAYNGTTAWSGNILKVLNGDMWVNANSGNIQINTANFTVLPSAGSVVNVEQNAIASDVYVLAGSVTVQDKTGSGTVVPAGQQLTLLANEVATTTNLQSKVEPIADFFKISDWFIKNGGDSLLSASSSSGSTASGTLSASGSMGNGNTSGLVLLSPTDESTVSNASVDISGRITNPSIVKVTINDQPANIDTKANTFTFNAFNLSNSENNLVYKGYDNNDGLVAKGVITVYSTAKQSAVSNTTQKATVVTYPISDKDFKILNPTDNPYKTTESVIRIEWQVHPGAVEYITINDFRLTKFVPLSGTWYYFANKDFWTLNDGINLYTIKYYDANGKLLTTNLLTIVKEEPNGNANTAVVQTNTGVTASDSGSSPAGQ